MCFFIDEIDAMGKKRDDQSSDERDQTLNALLSEMSGFRPSDGVIVLAATNRLDTLDPALLRPGRFDRQIEVGLPGKSERLSILKLHSRNKPMAEMSIGKRLRRIRAVSLALLWKICSRSGDFCSCARGGTHRGKRYPRGYFKTVAGADRPSTASRKERAVIALHEAGHALAARHLVPENRLTRVSILLLVGDARDIRFRFLPNEPCSTNAILKIRFACSWRTRGGTARGRRRRVDGRSVQ